MESKIVYSKDAPLEPTEPGCLRRILAWDKQIMATECNFEKGATPTVHSHPHSQNTYIVSGKYKFFVEGEEVIVGPGDSICFAPNAEHGLECLEAGKLVDVFTPYRETFVKK